MYNAVPMLSIFNVNFLTGSKYTDMIENSKIYTVKGKPFSYPCPSNPSFPTLWQPPLQLLGYFSRNGAFRHIDDLAFQTSRHMMITKSLTLLNGIRRTGVGRA